jgi:hypothetical protein
VGHHNSIFMSHKDELNRGKLRQYHWLNVEIRIVYGKSGKKWQFFYNYKLRFI